MSGLPTNIRRFMLSFIIPVFNPKEKIFERHCKGLLAQSLNDWEAIFVLDGPSDTAKSIIKRLFKKKNYQIIEIEHGGACRARNEGAKHAKGDIWCFFDSDCEIECDAAQAWVDLFNQKPEIGFIYAGYRFFDEKGGYGSEPFDPWLLRVNNYISTCFPFRKELFPGWNEDLKSLQDWDFWLKIVEKGAKGHHMVGYAFSTAAPDAESISGKGCTKENWLERIDAVKKLHNIPDNSVCVASLTDRHEGIRLAKMIDADYRDFPTRNPHRYKTIIQVGFSFEAGIVNECAGIFNDKSVNNYLFWTKDSVYEAYTMLSRKALIEYSTRLNATTTQFCEDKESQRLLELCGFKASILPLPFENEEVLPMPEKPRFLVDSSPHYGQVLTALEKSLPDIKLDAANNAQKIEDYSGMLHFHMEPIMSNSVKRMLVSGRHVISNIQQPFTGFIADHQSPDTFIPAIVERLRSLTTQPNTNAREYYLKMLSPEKLKERIGENIVCNTKS